MQSQALRAFEWTDLGTARAFSSLYGRDLRYCTDSKMWFLWSGVNWSEIHEGEVRQLIVRTSDQLRNAWRAEDAPEKSRDSALKYYRNLENRPKMQSSFIVAQDLPEIRMKYGEFDQDLWKLGVRNGEIDLRTGVFSEAKRESLLTKLAGTRYVPGVECPLWIKFLGQIFCGDQEIIETIQRALGYMLTGSVEEQVMFMFIGGGSNGKSTLVNIIARLLGDYAKRTPFSTFNASTRSDQSNDLAALAGARFVAIAESDEDSWLAEAKMKAATGGDPITCRFLNKEFFSYIPQYKIVMSANQLPGMKGMNHGNFRRPIIIPFKATFDGSQRIRNLEDLLMAEAPGILNWALEGLGRWQEDRLSVRLPQVLLDAKQAYKDEMDHVGTWFTERVEEVDDKQISRSIDLYTDYKERMTAFNHKPKAHKTWSQEMRAKGYEAVHKVNGQCYVGLRLKPDYGSYIPNVVPLKEETEKWKN